MTAGISVIDMTTSYPFVTAMHVPAPCPFQLAGHKRKQISMNFAFNVSSANILIDQQCVHRLPCHCVSFNVAAYGTLTRRVGERKTTRAADA